MAEGRWVLLIASEVGGSDSVSDRAMERLCSAIAEEGYEVVRTSTPEDGLSLVKSDPSHSAILLGWDLEGEHQFDTLAGFILHELKRIPKTGDTFEWRGFTFEIVDMDGQRIDKVIVSISDEIREEMD